MKIHLSDIATKFAGYLLSVIFLFMALWAICALLSPERTNSPLLLFDCVVGGLFLAYVNFKMTRIYSKL